LSVWASSQTPLGDAPADLLAGLGGGAPGEREGGREGEKEGGEGVPECPNSELASLGGILNTYPA